MKKIILLPILILVLVLGLLTLAAGPLLSWYISHNGPSLMGRDMYLDHASINLFTGGIEADSLVIYEADSQTQFLSISHINSHLSVSRLFMGTYYLSHLDLIHPRVEVQQRDTVFNFTDIIDYLTADSSPDDPALPLVIDGLQIQGGHIHYHDELVGSDFRFDNFSLFIPGIDLREIKTTVGISFELPEGGKLLSDIEFNDRAKTYKLDLKLSDLPLHSFLPYVQQSIALGDLQGILTLDLNIQGSSSHLMQSQLQGHASVFRLALTDPDNEPLVTCDTVTFGLRDIDLTQNRILLSRVMFHRPVIRIDYGRDSLDCYSRLIASAAAEQSVSSTNAEADTASIITFNDRERPFRLDIDQLQLRNGELNYRDESLKAEPFVYHLSEVNLTAPSFSIKGINHITASARLGQKGQFHFKYDGRIDNLRNLHAVVEASQIDVTDFSPYTIQMFGNEISRGTLSANLLIDTKEGELFGFNRIVIHDPKVEKKRRDVDPEMNIPFRAGMYILTDRNDICDIEIPVSGNIDDPKFNYKRLLFRTMGKLIVKVCTSPFRHSSSSGPLSVDAASLDSVSLEDVNPSLLNDE